MNDDHLILDSCKNKHKHADTLVNDDLFNDDLNYFHSQWGLKSIEKEKDNVPNSSTRYSDTNGTPATDTNECTITSVSKSSAQMTNGITSESNSSFSVHKVGPTEMFRDINLMEFSQ